MALGEDLKKEVLDIFKAVWELRDGTVVPEAEDLKLGNEGVKLDGTVLYADLAGSTHLVDLYKPTFAAEIYKSYLHCAAKIIKSEDGVITAYDGDRVMAIYIGDSKNTQAVRTAMKINYCVEKIINPAIKEYYTKETFQIQQVVGIDTSALMAARTGVRGANDLVWVGRAANYAAKLSSLAPSYATNITKTVYDAMNESVRVHEKQNMWTSASWSDMNNMTIYRSNWWWSL